MSCRLPSVPPSVLSRPGRPSWAEHTHKAKANSGPAGLSSLGGGLRYLCSDGGNNLEAFWCLTFAGVQVTTRVFTYIHVLGRGGRWANVIHRGCLQYQTTVFATFGQMEIVSLVTL